MGLFATTTKTVSTFALAFGTTLACAHPGHDITSSFADMLHFLLEHGQGLAVLAGAAVCVVALRRNLQMSREERNPSASARERDPVQG